VVIVGNYFPLGSLPPMTDELKKDMEVAAQKDLGLTYSVRLNHTKMQNMDAIELLDKEKMTRAPVPDVYTERQSRNP
jgi:hypothetical protein